MTKRFIVLTICAVGILAAMLVISHGVTPASAQTPTPTFTPAPSLYSIYMGGWQDVEIPGYAQYSASYDAAPPSVSGTLIGFAGRVKRYTSHSDSWPSVILAAYGAGRFAGSGWWNDGYPVLDVVFGCAAINEVTCGGVLYYGSHSICSAVYGDSAYQADTLYPMPPPITSVHFTITGEGYPGDRVGGGDVEAIYCGYPTTLPDRMALSSGALKSGIGGLNSASDPRECPVTGCNGTQGTAGDPVNTRTGGFDLGLVDLSISTLAGPLVFQRTYASPATGMYTTPLGYGWTHNQDTRLVFESGEVWFKAHSANQYRFLINGNSYVPYSGVLASLTYISPTYVLTNSAQAVYKFDAAGRLLTWADAQGHVLTYTYTSGQLSRVSDPTGQRYLSFAYNAPQGRLSSVSDPTGRAVSFGYGPLGDLITVTDVLSQVWRYTYSGTQHLLSGIIDPKGTTVLRNEYDSQGRVVRQFDGLTLTTQIAYTPGGSTVITDALSHVVTHTYTSRNVLVGSVNAAGRTTRFYDLNFRPMQTADANGNATYQTWSANGANLTQVVDAAGNRTSMVYDSRNHPVSVTDARGYTTTYGYVGNLLITTTDAMSGTVVNTYNSQGLLTRVINHGLTTTFGYDGLGQRVAMSDTLGNVTRFSYDAAGRLITTTAPTGLMTVNQYDNADRLIRVTSNYTITSSQQNYRNEYNLVTQYGYDAAGRQIAVTDTLGYVTRNYYDDAGRLISTTVNYTTTSSAQNYLGQYNLITRSGYDAAGNQILVTDTLTHVALTEYDALNRPVTVTTNYIPGGPIDAQTNLTRTTGYDAVGNVVTQTEPSTGSGQAGRMTVTQYDSLNRPVTVTTNYADGVYDPARPDEDLQTVTMYDSTGNATARRDAAGNWTAFEYDALARPLTTTNALSGTVVTRYNAAGQRVATLGSATSPMYFEYDTAGRLVTATNALSGTGVTVYDTWGRRVKSLDALTRSTVYTYSLTGRLIATADPGGAVTRYEYDTLGRTVVVTDALNQRTRTTYDALGRTVTVTNALSGTMATQYNALGWRIKTQDARGSWTEFGYDAVGRVITTTDATGRSTVVTYDRAGNQVQISNVRDQISNLQVFNQYDKLGRLIAQSDALSNTTRYGYDALGNRVVMTDANGIATRYGYDSLSRLVAVTESYTTTVGLNPNIYNMVTRYGYDAPSNRIAITDALTRTTVYTYDVLSRLVTESDPISHTTRYQYDAVSNRTVMTDANNHVTRYAYDAVNRPLVISYTADATTVKYAYDKVGNRLAMTDSTGVTSYVYDALYRPLTITSPFTGVVGYRYDPVGNRTNMIYPDGKVVTYTYDAANRLATVMDWARQTTTYTYDLAGRLVTTTLPNNVTAVNVYDAAGRLVKISNQSPFTTTVLSQYEYQLDAAGNRVVVTETMGAAGSTPTGTSTLLLGVQTIGDYQDYNPAGLAEAFQYTATASGTANTLYLYLDPSSSATQVIVGLYSNSANNDPGSLLAQATITNPINGAWNFVSLPATSIVSGAQYWIAVLGPVGAGTVRFRDVSQGGKGEGSLQTNLSALPASWSVGVTYGNSPLSAFVMQRVVVPADFPSTPVLDNFNRGNGPLGNNWSGETSSYSIASNQLDLVSDGYIFWNGSPFGADQEVFVTLTHVDPNGTEQDLLLKSLSLTGLYCTRHDRLVWATHSRLMWATYSRLM